LPQRLPLWAGLSLLLAGLGALAAFLYSTRVTTRRFRLEHLKVKTKSPLLTDKAGRANPDQAMSPGASRTLRILHISDLHLQKGDDKKVEFIRAITDDDFDMVVLTGDIFQFSDSFDYGPFLLSRQPRLGAYAVFGNHDYYDYSIVNKTIGRIFRKLRQPDIKKDLTPHREALAAGGFHVLVNESIYLPEANIFIAGIDYPGIKYEELLALVARAPQRPGLLKLCLFHLPWRLEQYAAAGFDMVFGGHTHGGQIRLPGFGAIITDSELHRSEASGLLRRGKTVFHISRGLGADPRSNIRIFCPPAATVIELTQSLVAVEAIASTI
jgi:predicted MPP superfamily phosphohydrolase